MPAFPRMLAERIGRLMGRAVTRAASVDRGYTPAERWVVDLEDGARVFAKSGADSATSAVATWLRREHEAYVRIEADFMPRLLGWEDDGVAPLLVLEDLSGATWPPPWNVEAVAAVGQMLASVARTAAPAGAPDLEAAQRERLSGWVRISSDRAPFLGLGVVTGAWLERALPVLVDVSARAELRGDSLVHFDVRSDNLCLQERRALLIDWPGYARGSALFDLASWLPSLWREGGPPPWEVLPESEGLSALLAGYFAAQAGLPAIPTAPGVRDIQRAQLEAALPWAVRELGLPDLDGPASRDPQVSGQF